MKTAQLPPLLVLTYTYFYSENSPAATSLGVNLHIFYSQNSSAATSDTVYFESETNPHTIFFLPDRGPEHANTLTLY